MRKLMKIKLLFLLLFHPVLVTGGDYSTSLVVQTGMLREGDLVVRHVTDLASHKTCLAFYVRTAGTSPTIHCYDVTGEFGTTIRQVSHIKRDDIVLRKIEDIRYAKSCLVAYVSTPGTSPALACHDSITDRGGVLRDAGHLREGDLDVYLVHDLGTDKVCLVAHVRTENTAPSMYCYPAMGPIAGSLTQTAVMREGDLIVRKVVDAGNQMACMVTYVATPQTSPRLFCFTTEQTAAR